MTLLYDQFGREIKANKPILQEVAVQTIRDRYSSYPSQGLTPERLAAILKEADQGNVLRQAELAEEIEEKDGHLGSVLQSRKLAVAGLSWEILPGGASAQDKKIADAAKEMVEYIGSTDPHDEGFEGGMIDSLDAVLKAYAVQEIMWEIVGGQVYAKSLNWIHQKRFTFSGPQQQVGSQTIWPLLNVPRLLTDAEPTWGEELLPNKFMFHRHKSRSGATSRGGLLRAVVYMYLFKNYDLKDWLVFNDLFSVPMRVGKYKAGASPTDIDVLKKAVFNLGVDAAAVISDSTIIELLEAATRTNAGGFKELADYCEKIETKVVLGHSSAADSTPGKLGNETQGQDLRQDLLEADAKQIERTYRFQLLGPWKTYNYGPDAAIPKLKLHYEADEDLGKLAETYGKLVTTVGFTDISLDHIHERFGIPVPEEGEELITKPQPASPFGALPTNPMDGGRGPQKGQQQLNKLPCGCQTHGSRRLQPAHSKLRTPNAELSLLINSIGSSDASWQAEYLKRIQPLLQNAKAGALEEIKTWLESQETPPSDEVFITKAKEILGKAYANIDQRAVTEAVADIYGSYKNTTPGIQAAAAFGGADLRAVSWLSDVDGMFYSKFISNPDANDAVTRFLTDRYLKGGEGLFGRGNPATIEEFVNLLGQKMTEISGFQAQRIADTSIQRIRSFAHISQLAESGAQKIRIIEPTEECDFCRAMNGEEIEVDSAYGLMQELMGKTPDGFVSWLQQNLAILSNTASFVKQGVLPPYHPFCHGFFVIA